MASFVRVGAHSSTLLFVHLVWATRERHPLLEPSVDAWLAALLEHKVLALDGELIAAGNAADHVHVIASYPSRVTVANLAQHLKGASSRAIALELRWEFAWQAGYWAESVGHRELPSLVEYVRRQRVHHARRAELEPWESSV